MENLLELSLVGISAQLLPAFPLERLEKLSLQRVHNFKDVLVPVASRLQNLQELSIGGKDSS
jgi:hypothetical protein